MLTLVETHLITHMTERMPTINGTGHKRAKCMIAYTVSDELENFDDIWTACNEGDIISHGRSLSSSFHSQIIYEYTIGVTPRDLKVAQHTYDDLDRSLYVKGTGIDT